MKPAALGCLGLLLTAFPLLAQTPTTPTSTTSKGADRSATSAISDSVPLVNTAPFSVMKLSETGSPKARVDSLAGTRLEPRKTRQWVRRIVFGSSAVMAGGLGFYYNNRASEASRTYHSETSYDVAVYDNNWATYEELARKRNVFYGIAGALALGLAISIPF